MIRSERGEHASKGFAHMRQNQSQSDYSKFNAHDPGFNTDLNSNVKQARYCPKPNYTTAFAMLILPLCYLGTLKEIAKKRNDVKKKGQSLT